jgi:hypothetical protein
MKYMIFKVGHHYSFLVSTHLQSLFFAPQTFQHFIKTNVLAQPRVLSRYLLPLFSLTWDRFLCFILFPWVAREWVHLLTVIDFKINRSFEIIHLCLRWPFLNCFLPRFCWRFNYNERVFPMRNWRHWVLSNEWMLNLRFWRFWRLFTTTKFTKGFEKRFIWCQRLYRWKSVF